YNRPPALPVGILSFLADELPYPPEALDILVELNPFLANQLTNAVRLEELSSRSKRWGSKSKFINNDSVRYLSEKPPIIENRINNNYNNSYNNKNLDPGINHNNGPSNKINNSNSSNI